MIGGPNAPVYGFCWAPETGQHQFRLLKQTSLAVPRSTGPISAIPAPVREGAQVRPLSCHGVVLKVPRQAGARRQRAQAQPHLL
jgi:hypothetical protein